MGLDTKALVIDEISFVQGVGIVDADTIKALSGLEFLSKIQVDELPQPSIHQTFDFRMAEIEEGRAVFTGKPSAAFMNPMGTVHGSYISALLDSAMACSAHSLCPAGTANTTVEMKINFVRPIFKESGRLFATGVVINAGRTLVTTEGNLADENGKLYAHGTQTCMRMVL